MNLDNKKVKESILDILANNPDGVTQKTFQDAIPDLAPESLLKFIIELTNQSTIEAIELKNKSVIWKIKKLNILALEKRLTPEEARINKQIRNSGSKGISNNVLKKNFNLKESDFTRIEKRLLALGLVKQYKFNSQKICVAIDSKPESYLTERNIVAEDRHTMGVRVGDIRDVVVDLLKKRDQSAQESHARLRNQHNAAAVSLRNIHEHLDRVHVTKIQRRELRLLVDSLVNSEDIVLMAPPSSSLSIKSDKVDDDSDSSGNHLYYRYRRKPATTIPSFVAAPCVLCPHKEYCAPGAALSPESCPYMTRFIEDVL